MECYKTGTFIKILLFLFFKVVHMIPVAVNGALKELHGILRLAQLPVGRPDLSTHPADAGVALESVGPPLRFLIHHLKNVASTPLRCGQLLEHLEHLEIKTTNTLNAPGWHQEFWCNHSLRSSSIRIRIRRHTENDIKESKNVFNSEYKWRTWVYEFGLRYPAMQKRHW